MDVHVSLIVGKHGATAISPIITEYTPQFYHNRRRFSTGKTALVPRRGLKMPAGSGKIEAEKV